MCRSQQISPKEFVKFNEGGTAGFGIEGYTLKSPIVTGFDKSISWGVPKDAGKRSFLETVIKEAKEK